MHDERDVAIGLRYMYWLLMIMISQLNKSRFGIPFYSSIQMGRSSEYSNSWSPRFFIERVLSQCWRHHTRFNYMAGTFKLRWWDLHGLLSNVRSIGNSLASRSKHAVAWKGPEHSLALILCHVVIPWTQPYKSNIGVIGTSDLGRLTRCSKSVTLEEE